MKVELKSIIKQLNEALYLDKGQSVSALIDTDNDDEIIGWTIVNLNENGDIKTVGNHIYENIRQLLINRFLNDEKFQFYTKAKGSNQVVE